MVSSAACWADAAGVAWASGDAACWWADAARVVCWAGAACSTGADGAWAAGVAACWADGAWAGSSLMAASSASIWALNWAASSEAPTSWQELLG